MRSLYAKKTYMPPSHKERSDEVVGAILIFHIQKHKGRLCTQSRVMRKDQKQRKNKLVGLGQWSENHNQEKFTFIFKSLGHGTLCKVDLDQDIVFRWNQKYCCKNRHQCELLEICCMVVLFFVKTTGLGISHWKIQMIAIHYPFMDK